MEQEQFTVIVQPIEVAIDDDEVAFALFLCLAPLCTLIIEEQRGQHL
jgi:hypothetical protein